VEAAAPDAISTSSESDAEAFVDEDSELAAVSGRTVALPTAQSDIEAIEDRASRVSVEAA
jgi:hypothetical protein